ncbi:MAG: hypothetical protein ACI8PW_001106 [Methylophilaceae bacterium]|jgi:hypothetical protein
MGVHDWVQHNYNLVLEEFPDKSFLYRGNIVRLLSDRESQKYPTYKRNIQMYL